MTASRRPAGRRSPSRTALILVNDPKMREEQGRMSKRMLQLLRLDTERFQKATGEALARRRKRLGPRGS